MPDKFIELYKKLRIIKKRDVIIINEFLNMEFLNVYDYIFEFCKKYNLLPMYDKYNKCNGFAIDNYFFIFKNWENYNTTVYYIAFRICSMSK